MILPTRSFVGLAGLAAVAGLAGGAAAQQPDPTTGTDKLDHGLATAGGHTAVFVRMVDQMFAGAGDYEAFCAQHAEAPRSVVRAASVARLRAAARASRAALRDTVARLEQSGALRATRHFWIINGFGCDATAAACRALAARPEVAFVYRQRQPGGTTQHRSRWRDERWVRARRADVEAALAQWTPDEPDLEADGLVVGWNLERIHAPRAWRAGARGQGVVIALLDSGVVVTPALSRALWRNRSEKLDGKDTDHNGFVDDLFGWDFQSDRPTPIGDGPRSHGTMCGGILAGRPAGDPVTVTGVAPHARLMVLRGAGALAAYEYAVLNGADVLSMSYMWAGIDLGHYRGVFRCAHEHLAACGVVAVGGAGNFKKTAPKGQQIALPKDIPCVIAAAGILRNGRQAPFSSEGPCSWRGVRFFDDHPALPKPDVTGIAGGFAVWHPVAIPGGRLPHDQVGDDGVGLVRGAQGNSFAGPHAGGVAALMLSANPELTPWRVQALLAATCEDLGPPGRDLAYGAGLVQADAAVKAARAARVVR